MLLSSLVMTQDVSKPPLPPLPRLALGTAVALAVSCAFYVFAHLLGLDDKNASGFVSVSFVLGMPMMAPVLLVRIVDPQGRLAGWQHGLLGLFMFVGLMLAGLAVEGWGVCMVIVAPIFLWLSPICAILAGELLRERHQKGRLPVTVLPAVPFLLLPLDKQFLPPPEAVEVATSALVAAPPQEVWTALAEARNIRREEQRFTLAQSILSIPRPVDARLDRAGIGGVRHVRWERGVHFDEVVTDWQPGKRLAWRFAFQPDSFGQTIDGHIFPDSAYLKVSNGEYRLVAVPGGTRVTLITRYRLATRLNGWCRLWGEVLIGDFHRNVLHVMAGRASSEQSAKTARLVGFADGQS